MISRVAKYIGSKEDSRKWPLSIDLEEFYRFLDELKAKVQAEQIILKSVHEKVTSSSEEYSYTTLSFEFVEAKVDD